MEVLHAMARAAIQWQCYDAALDILLLGFLVYFRTGKLLDLHVRQLTFVNRSELVFRLPETKGTARSRVVGQSPWQMASSGQRSTGTSLIGCRATGFSRGRRRTSAPFSAACSANCKSPPWGSRPTASSAVGQHMPPAAGKAGSGRPARPMA